MGGGRGVLADRIKSEGIQEYFIKLARRLRHTHIVCGDWSRVLTPSALGPSSSIGIMLDPPYYAGLSDGLYAHADSTVSARVRQWAIDNGSNPNYRIALCGYEGEHQMPPDWEVVEWKASGGYGSQRQDGTNQNAERERIWFSPHCLKVTDSLWAYEDNDEDNDEQSGVGAGDPAPEQDLSDQEHASDS